VSMGQQCHLSHCSLLCCRLQIRTVHMWPPYCGVRPRWMHAPTPHCVVATALWQPEGAHSPALESGWKLSNQARTATLTPCDCHPGLTSPDCTARWRAQQSSRGARSGPSSSRHPRSKCASGPCERRVVALESRPLSRSLALSLSLSRSLSPSLPPRPCRCSFFDSFLINLRTVFGRPYHSRILLFTHFVHAFFLVHPPGHCTHDTTPTLEHMRVDHAHHLQACSRT
jgi:hypothetical protein